MPCSVLLPSALLLRVVPLGKHSLVEADADRVVLLDNTVEYGLDATQYTKQRRNESIRLWLRFPIDCDCASRLTIIALRDRPTLSLHSSPLTLNSPCVPTESSILPLLPCFVQSSSGLNHLTSSGLKNIMRMTARCL